MEQVRFFGLSLESWPGRVMTPRPATEQLVATALDLIADRPARVADVGTGSGAVAIAIAAAAPQVEVWAIDTGRRAVALARRNVRRHGLEGRVEVRRGDLLDPVPGSLDLIVANLPYLPAAEAHRHPDLRLEPANAVFASGDGLNPYRRLVEASARRLTATGLLAIQLHRRIVVADGHELAALELALNGRAAHPRAPALVGAAA